MPDLNPQVSLLTAEEVDMEVTPVTELPGATALEEKKETPLDKPKEKAKENVPPVQEKTSTTTQISLLTDDEVEVVPETEKTETKKYSKKEIESALDYKALIEAKIESGDWEKWDNWDEVKDETEFTPELYLELEREQFNTKVQKQIEEEKAALPKRIQEITEFIKNGGKEEELYSTYQQELDIEALDPTSVEDAEELVRAHCEATGWSEKKTKSYLESLKDKGEDELKEAAEEAKTALVEVVKEEREGVLKEQARMAEQRRIYAETFNKKIRESIYKEVDTPEREKKETEKFLFDYKHTDPETGAKVSDFGMKWKEVMTDPIKYHKFVKFMKNFDNYEEKSKAEKEVKSKVYNFLRTGQQDLGKNSSTATPDLQKINRTKGQYNPFAKLNGV